MWECELKKAVLDATVSRVQAEILANGEAHRIAVEERRKAREDYRRERRQQKEREAALILRHIEKCDRVVLLDEHGMQHTSVEFSKYLQKQMNAGVRNLAFVVGGAFGFADSVYAAANDKLSLSKMTFNHQMVRLFFVEQLYRAFTIQRNEPYHNE